MSFLKNVPTVTPKVSYEESLWNTIESGMGKKDSFFKKGIHPSDAACVRYNALTIESEVNNDSSSQLALFAHMGNCIEEFVVNSLEKTNKLIATQYRPSLSKNDPKLPVSGMVDIIYFNEHNQPAILEVKSTKQITTKEVTSEKDGKVTRTKNKGIADSNISLSHLTQTLIYSGLTGITDVSILYISRNVVETFNGGIAHHIYKVDTSIPNIVKVFTNLYYSYLCWQENIIPEKPSGFRKTVECKFCNLQDKCYNEIPDGERNEKLFEKAEIMAYQFAANKQERYDFMLSEIIANTENTIQAIPTPVNVN